ncbi:MAG: helix-turn-helix domain-containing protein [Bacteroidetes bacterium]|nr:helix-turn-helix domain-containing protein [Bacteroidota bacterium]
MSNASISIVVLPFVNLSGDHSREYLADGITEEIINALSRVEQLRVISRTSSFFYKGKDTSMADLANTLNVTTVLEGSVRFEGNAMRISTQLIQVEDESAFWSASWDRDLENIFAIQDEISLMIADKLREHLGHLDVAEHLTQQPTNDLAAWDHYLNGAFHFRKWNPEDANLAIGQFEKALALDPNLIEAHLGLADSYSFLAVAGFAPREESWLKAIECIQSAQAINPNHAGLNYMMANQAFFTEASFSKAFQLATKAMQIRPTYPEAQQFISFLHELRGDFAKAKEHLLYAKSIDPLNQETRFYEAYYAYRTENYSTAKTILNELLDANPRNLPALITYMYIHVLERDAAGTQQLLDNIPEAMITPDERLGIQCLIDELNHNLAPSKLQELESFGQHAPAHHAHAYLFLLYARMGRNDEAFNALNRLFEVHSSVLLLSFSDPLAKPLQTDPRYAEFHHRIYQLEQHEEPAQKANSHTPDEVWTHEVLHQLEAHMPSEKPFLNPSLSLRFLADQLSVHPNQLSWLLNEKVGKNFNEFVNDYRIEHFKKLVADDSNRHISLVGLAFESGFNSKTVFNTTFKKKTGLTPKAYQKSVSAPN